jgi:hypothetical protein
MFTLVFNIQPAKAIPTPTLYSPANGSTVSTGKPTFDWSDVTGATYYQIIVDNNSDWSSPEVRIWNLTVSNYTPTITLKNGKYYWTVTAYVDGQWGPWASTWTFTVKTSENYAPPTPSPTSPYNGATGVSLTPTLSCSSVTDPDGDAVKYVFWLDDDSDVWNDRIWTKNNTSPTITVPVNVLEYGKTYYWAVYAHDGKAGSGLSPVWKFTTTTTSINAEKTLGVKAGDWIKYEYITIETAGGHPWVKLEVTNTKDTIVTVLWSTGATGGVSIPNLPAFGLTVSWDIKTGGDVYSYFVIHANPKVGDSVTVLPGITLQIKGEDTRTYAGVSRKVVYADYSALGLQYKYFWDKETGVLVESSTIMGGFDFTMKAVETNLWQAGFGGLPLWIVGVVIAIVAAATIAFIVFLMKRKQPHTKPQPAPSQLATEVKYCIKCGVRMPLDATYCTKCGQKQP